MGKNAAVRTLPVAIVAALILGTLFLTLFFPERTATETWEFRAASRQILLKVLAGSVSILPGNSTSVYVVAVERANGLLSSFAGLQFSAKVANGTLDVSEAISSQSPWVGKVAISVYLPPSGFDAIAIVQQTGDVQVNYTSLAYVSVKVQTGNVKLFLPTAHEMMVETNVGNVYIAVDDSGVVNVSTGTGSVTFRTHTLGCTPVSIDTITGRVLFNTSALQSFRLNATTVNGRIVLEGSKQDYNVVNRTPNSISISSGSGCASVVIGSVDGTIYIQA